MTEHDSKNMTSSQNPLSANTLSGKALSNKLLSSDSHRRIFAQLSMLLEAGIPPVSALDIMIRDKDNRDLQPVLKEIYHSVCTGAPLSDAMKATRVFTPYSERLIIIGEETGHIDLVTKSLAEFYEEDMDMQDQIQSAVSYPIVMLVMIFVVIIVLLRHVLPVFRQVYAGLGASEGGLAGALMNLGESMGRYYTGFLIAFAVIACIFLYCNYTERGRNGFRGFIAWFPGTRTFAEHAATSRFASGMELTQEAGLDMIESLSLCTGIVENKAVRGRIEQCVSLIREGSSFADAVIRVNMFSSFYSSMTNVAEQSGSVDRVMGFISRHYKEETDRRINRAIAAIEPTLVIILSVIVGLILLGMILPVMGIMTSIG